MTKEEFAAKEITLFCEHVMHPSSDLHEDAKEWIKERLQPNHIMKNGYVPQEFIDAEAKLYDKINREFMYKSMNDGFDVATKRAKQNPDNLKWAYIVVGKTKKRCWVDNVTNKAYKADGYNKTNIEIKDFYFDRWCTGFDL